VALDAATGVVKWKWVPSTAANGYGPASQQRGVSVGEGIAITTAAGNRLGGLTDNDGNFVVSAVPPGPVTVRALRIGYAPATQTVTVPASGAVEVTFVLDRAATQLSEVVTTATGPRSGSS